MTSQNLVDSNAVERLEPPTPPKPTTPTLPYLVATVILGVGSNIAADAKHDIAILIVLVVALCVVSITADYLVRYLAYRVEKKRWETKEAKNK